MQVVCKIDEDLRRRGSFLLTQELRSLLKNFCTGLDVHLVLPDQKVVAARFHKLNATFKSINLARWLNKAGIDEGGRLALETLGPEIMNAFRVVILETEPEEEAADEVDPLELDPMAGLRGPDADQDPSEPKPKELESFDEVHRFNHDSWVGLVDQLEAEPASKPDLSMFHLRHMGERAKARDGFTELRGLGTLQGVDLYDHQLEAVRKVFSEFQGRGILADEVGLGKTIEASMIITEYLHRGMVEKFLVLCPASLVRQWQEELRTKFGIEAITHMELESWDAHPYVVASLDTAKGAKHAKELAKADFDLVVVDEAHKLKNQRTRNWKFVRELEARFLLLLTATPIQNSIEELYNLIYLVRPGLLSTRKSFRAEFVQQSNRRVPRNVKRLRELVGNVMVRSRRCEANIQFTDRVVELVPVRLEGEEGDLYHMLDMFIREHYAQLPYFEKGMNRLTLMLLERMVTSSPRALAGTITRLLEKGNLPPSFVEGLDRIRTKAESLDIPAKLRAALDAVKKADDRVLIYTQFRDSQAALADHLEAAGHKVFRFHGGLPIKEKDTVIHRFRDCPKGILISTDAGAEGRNLQFCRTLINYDLPWNPMKVEQRIGRVHRLGQKSDVQIVNLYYEGSIEEYVVRLLTEKIKLFTMVVGELDSILGLADTKNDIETEIMDAFMSADEANELEDRFDRLGDQFDRAYRDYDGMKNAQDAIFDVES